MTKVQVILTIKPLYIYIFKNASLSNLYTISKLNQTKVKSAVTFFAKEIINAFEQLETEISNMVYKLLIEMKNYVGLRYDQLQELSFT